MQFEKYDTDKLVELLKVRNPDAVEYLYDSYSSVFYGSISRLIPQKAAVDEIMLKSFVTILRQIDRYNTSQSLFSWMYAIIFREVSLWHEQEKRNVPM